MKINISNLINNIPMSSFFRQITSFNNQSSTINHQKSTRSGFTLIEILIVVAVVTFLMAVLFPNFMGARQRARDAQRKSDLAQIQRALELFKSDQDPPSYPTTGAFPADLCGNSFSSAQSTYMRKFPCDPAGGLTPTPYIYSLDGDTLKYYIVSCLENLADPDRDAANLAICSNIGKVSYTVNEP
jgi:type II secretion system protein G